MKTYYLVDYENVHSDGLKGIAGLGADDKVLVFYTQNNKKIDLDVLKECKGTDLKFFKVESGKQSVDMHIASYLGSLIRTETRVVIISGDTDYDKLIRFWSENSKACTCRCSHICDSNKKKKADIDADKSGKQYAKSLRKALAAETHSQDVIDFTVKTALKNRSANNKKQQTYQALTAKYGLSEGRRYYTSIKKLL